MKYLFAIIAFVVAWLAWENSQRVTLAEPTYLKHSSSN